MSHVLLTGSTKTKARKIAAPKQWRAKLEVKINENTNHFKINTEA